MVIKDCPAFLFLSAGGFFHLATMDALRQVHDRIDFLNVLMHYDYILLQMVCQLETVLPPCSVTMV
jgi:hypothetical protein